MWLKFVIFGFCSSGYLCNVKITLKNLLIIFRRRWLFLGRFCVFSLSTLTQTIWVFLCVVDLKSTANGTHTFLGQMSSIKMIVLSWTINWWVQKSHHKLYRFAFIRLCWGPKYFPKKWNFEYLIILSYDNTILLNKPQLDKYTRGSHDVIKRHVNIY